VVEAIVEEGEELGGREGRVSGQETFELTQETGVFKASIVFVFRDTRSYD
jgi:hypothetical protein